MTRDEYDDVLIDGIDYALLGAMYDDDEMIPCYDAQAVADKLAADGHSEDSAAEIIERLTEGRRLVWIKDIDLEEEKPTLKLVH